MAYKILERPSKIYLVSSMDASAQTVDSAGSIDLEGSIKSMCSVMEHLHHIQYFLSD